MLARLKEQTMQAETDAAKQAELQAEKAMRELLGEPFLESLCPCVQLSLLSSVVTTASQLSICGMPIAASKLCHCCGTASDSHVTL